MENVPIATKPPLSDLRFCPTSVQLTQGPAPYALSQVPPGRAGSVLQLLWGKVPFTYSWVQPFPGWVVLRLNSCSGLDSRRELELCPERHVLSFSQSFCFPSERKN